MRSRSIVPETNLWRAGKNVSAKEHTHAEANVNLWENGRIGALEMHAAEVPAILPARLEGVLEQGRIGLVKAGAVVAVVGECRGGVRVCLCLLEEDVRLCEDCARLFELECALADAVPVLSQLAEALLGRL